MSFLKEYKDKIYGFIFAFIGGCISFIVTVKIIPTSANSSFQEILFASFIIGVGAGFPTLYSISQQYSLRKNLKILIYEDNEHQRENLVKNLKNADYDVIAFGSGEFQKAIEAVKQDKKIKVAIVDQMIFDANRKPINDEQGFELVQAFSNCDRGDIQCIMLTGELLKASRSRSNRDLAEKIDNYLKNENVVDVIHKQLYEIDDKSFTQALYTRIIRQIDAAINPHSADLMAMTGTFEKSQSSPNFLPNF